MLIRLITFFSFLFSQNIGIPYFIEDKQVIEHEYYVLSYSEKHEQAYWVSYLLDSSRLNGGIDRTNDFRIDPFIKTGSATLSDYKGSGYDRGHLVPAADMNFALDAMSETFYMSNMSPQVPSFNRGIWKKLESLVREWANYEGVLYIVTGPIFTTENSFIGKNKVSIPQYFYKVILDYVDPEMKGIGFILPNNKSKQPLQSFSVSIDSVESITGIDFFFRLPDDLEKEIESNYSFKKWGLSKVGLNKIEYEITSTNKTKLNYAKVNINSATRAELMTLPGIGEKLSMRIIEHRKNYGNFRSIEEMQNIKGIGSKTIKRLKDKCTY